MTDGTEWAREEARKIVAKHLGKYGPGSSMEEEIVRTLVAAERRGEEREREGIAEWISEVGNAPHGRLNLQLPGASRQVCAVLSDAIRARTKP